MEQNDLTFHELLTWDDIIQLGDPNGITSVHLGNTFFFSCCSKKYHQDLFMQDVKKYYIQPFLEKFPDFPFSMNDFDFRICYVKDDNELWKLRLSKPYFVAWLLEKAVDNKMKNENRLEAVQALIHAENDLKEVVKAILTDEKLSLSETIRSFNDRTHTFRINNSTQDFFELPLNNFVERRSKVNWCIRNLDKIFDYLEQDIDFNILQPINKDLFLLNIASYALNNSNILKFLDTQISIDGFMHFLDSNRISASHNYINNYNLMVTYLKQENQKSYEVNLQCHTSNGDYVLASNTILDEFHKFQSYLKEKGLYEEYLEKINGFYSYEELLSTKASKTWKRIQSEKYAKNIRLNFEMIQSGKKITLSSYQKGVYVKKNSNSEKRQAKLKYAYDLLEEKLEYYPQTQPRLELVGMDTFTGYFANIYSNGVVVLDKLYKRSYQDKNGKEVIIPATEEAIYVMNYTEFVDLCRYSKPELIQEITQYQNPNVSRILHTKDGKWKIRVDKWIDGPGYGELDYELFDQLIGNLKEDSKILRK